jgi:hypothetical protein
MQLPDLLLKSALISPENKQGKCSDSASRYSASLLTVKELLLRIWADRGGWG